MWLKILSEMGIEFNEKIIGYADLACMKDKTAELGIAIGESRSWGRGLGSNAAICMYDGLCQKIRYYNF